MDSSVFVYVKSERARGVRDEDIRSELVAKGWSTDDIDLVLLGNRFKWKKLLTERSPVRRMGRKQYALASLFFIGFVVVSIFFIAVTSALYDIPTSYRFTYFISGVLAIACCVITVLLLVRCIRATIWRLHDIGMSTVQSAFLVILMVLFYIMPELVLLIILPYLFFRSRSKTDNTYGPPPDPHEPAWHALQGLQKL